MIDRNDKTPMVAAIEVLNTDNKIVDNDLDTLKYTTFDQPVQLTKLTSNNPEILSKSYRLTGAELKKSSAGQMVRGEFQILQCGSIESFCNILKNLKLNEALTYGVPQWVSDQGSIASRNAAAPGELTRTRENFDWPQGPGILFLDYDPPKGAKSLSAEEVWQILTEICPALATAPVVILSSASGFIYNSETEEELKGAGGWHLYVIVKDGRDSSRAGKVIFEMGWLAGHGRYDISNAGSLLERSFVDAAVWQPERLDFAAGASCEFPLEQRRPAPLVINPTAPLFDTTLLKTAQDSEELTQIKAAARELVDEEARNKRIEWVESRVTEAMSKFPESDPNKRDDKKKQLRVTYSRAADDCDLMSDFILYPENGPAVSVGKVLENPEEWHGKRFADPLEPGYRNDKRIAWANLQSGRRPTLYSHAHGGQRYHLLRAQQIISLSGGELPRVVSEVQAVINKNGAVFQRGGELVRVADGLMLAVIPPWLKTHCETVCRFETYKNKSIQVDCPGELPQRILANRGGWPFSDLKGIETAPTMRPDGSLLDKPGYDQATGLLLLDDLSEKWPAIPNEPSPEHARAALLQLMEPFEHFPFVGPVDRGVTVAAMLTAVVRRTLPTAPGFGIGAFQMGTGKTKLAQCLGILTSGHTPAVAPWADNTEEQRKMLMAALLSGPGAVLLDNIERQLSSSELCAVLTGETYEDRRLGFSERVKVSTRVLILATGNNLCIAGDLSRRVLPINLDHGVEHPEALSFPFDPVARVAETWLQLRAACLTILRAFIVAGQPARGKGRIGSFEVWDSMVRQCIVWLRDKGLAPFEVGDPAESISATINADPDTQKLRNLLFCWERIFKEAPTKAAELIGAGTTNSSLPTFNELGETLLEIAGDGNYINPRRLGRWIERHAGRLLDGKRIVEAGYSGGARRWRLVSTPS